MYSGTNKRKNLYCKIQMRIREYENYSVNILFLIAITNCTKLFIRLQTLPRSSQFSTDYRWQTSVLIVSTERGHSREWLKTIVVRGTVVVPEIISIACQWRQLGTISLCWHTFRGETVGTIVASVIQKPIQMEWHF